MTWVVRLAQAADIDVREARRWYKEQAPQVAPAFRAELNATFRRIASNPQQYPIVRQRVRRALVHRFPYAVFYRVFDESVLVIAITHQSRDPEVWKQR